MRRFCKTIVLAFATLLSISICSAQQAATTSVPNLVRYSGTLKDAQGASLSSSTAVGVTFSIYKQQDGGAAVWMETQNVTPDANGQYSVVLGSTTSTGLPNDLFSHQEQRWLGVQLQGQDEQARVLLVSVPYAFKAHEAETLGGLPASAFVKAPPTGAAGSSSMDGTAVNALSTSGKPGGTGTSGGVLPKTVSDCLNPTLGAITLWSKLIQISPPIWELCNSNLFQVLTGPSAGNIGIGNTNPSKSLDVNGEINTRKWYDIANPELAFAGVGFQDPNILPNNRDTFVGVGAGTIAPLNPPVTPLGETDNTFVGYYAGSNTRFSGTAGTGIYNTFTGSQAGRNNTTGTGNVFIGYQAGFKNTTQGDNTFVGTFAGFNSRVLTPPSKNTFIGHTAGFQTTTGYRNTAVGYDAGRSNVTGLFNACFGDNACLSQNSSGVILPTFGSANTCLGTGACSSTSTAFPFNGSNNICVGTGTCNNENSPSNSIEIGNSGATHYGNGSIQIGNVVHSLSKKTYIQGIWTTSITNNPQMVVVDLVGHLGSQPIPTGGGGNVVGPNPPCAAGFLPKWSGGLNVDCSVVYQQTGTNFIGIGTTNPSEALDVAGNISANPHGTPDRSSYQIGETTVLTAFGSGNTVVGFTNAHATNTGTNNTFVGAAAGTSNNTGARNTFVGSQAGQSNNGGFNNTFVGWLAGVSTDAGDSNTFVGLRAGQNNASGVGNSFYGRRAGTANVLGTYNLYLGTDSDENNAAGHNNIYLSNPGAPENNTIRIGGSTAISGFGPQTDTYIVGIYAATPNFGTAPYKVVCIAKDSKLWGAPFGADCTLSSRRFKENILDMGDGTNKLFQLRPVTFSYKAQYDDGSHLLQYGLIAEEVAKVYPEMVAYDRDGQPYTVKYQLLAPMLLNELQKQHKVVAAQQSELQTQLQQIKTQQQQMQAQRQEIDGLKLHLQQQNASLQERLSKLESYVATQMKTASDNPPRTTPSANGGLQ